MRERVQVRKIRNLKRVEGIIFEIVGMCAKVARYGCPEDEYIEEEIIQEEVRLWEYIRPEDRKNIAMETLVRRAAEEICPEAQVVYFEVLLK